MIVGICFEVEVFKEGEKVISEGEPGEKFYIIEAYGCMFAHVCFGRARKARASPRREAPK